jgi:hypothetical protein
MDRLRFVSLMAENAAGLYAALSAAGGIARLVPVADADYDPIREMARIAAAVEL